MILVDTSVWVAALRHRGAEAHGLWRLFDEDAVLVAAPVRIEILCGASRRDRVRLRRLLSALPIAYPEARTWQRLDKWIDMAGERGERFGFADLLIGALAADRDVPVWSLDEDFMRLARLGLIQLYQAKT